MSQEGGCACVGPLKDHFPALNRPFSFTRIGHDMSSSFLWHRALVTALGRLKDHDLLSRDYSIHSKTQQNLHHRNLELMVCKYSWRELTQQLLRPLVTGSTDTWGWGAPAYCPACLPPGCCFINTDHCSTICLIFLIRKGELDLGFVAHFRSTRLTSTTT